jgi:hypothetical protein
MKIGGNREGFSLALSTTREEQTIYCSKGRWLVLGLGSVVCKLKMLSTNLLNLNTITRRFLTRQELQKRCMQDVP